jgi:general secretion pathway protein L
MDLQAPIAEAVARASSIILLLPEVMVLRRSMDIPVDALTYIDNAMPFLVERHTPFIAANARYAHRIIGRKGKQMVTVELAVTSHSLLQRIETALSASGVHSTSIRVSGDSAQPGLEFSKARSWRNMMWRQPFSRIVVYAAVLILFLGPLAIDGFVHNSLMRETAAMRIHQVEFSSLQTAKRAFERQSSTLGFFRALATEPTPLEILGSLTDALPDNCWLFRLEVSPSTVRIAGYSHDVPAILRHLESLPWVQRVEFQSPVIHNTRQQGERFELLIQLRSAAS